ncbi:MAG: hypothetical protein KDK39_09945 [Leptospiraceae bacterium]|nr:hypothetical protein [Leptospiraceae bacterium]
MIKALFALLICLASSVLADNSRLDQLHQDAIWHELVRAKEDRQSSAKPVYEIDFNHESGQNFMVHAELELWARNRNLLLVPDDPGRNLQDGIAVVISEQGLFYQLDVPVRGRSWLYLDLVRYKEGANRPQLHKLSWLDVYANRMRLTRIYQGAGALPDAVIRIPIDREHAPEGILQIHLRPAPGDSVWAIWDSYISRY